MMLASVWVTTWAVFLNRPGGTPPPRNQSSENFCADSPVDTVTAYAPIGDRPHTRPGSWNQGMCTTSSLGSFSPRYEKRGFVNEPGAPSGVCSSRSSHSTSDGSSHSTVVGYSR